MFNEKSANSKKMMPLHIRPDDTSCSNNSFVSSDRLTVVLSGLCEHHSLDYRLKFITENPHIIQQAIQHETSGRYLYTNDLVFSENETVKTISFQRFRNLYSLNCISIRRTHHFHNVLVIEHAGVGPLTPDMRYLSLHSSPAVLQDLSPRFDFRGNCCSNNFVLLVQNLEFCCWELIGGLALIPQSPHPVLDDISVETTTNGSNNQEHLNQNPATTSLPANLISSSTSNDLPVITEVFSISSNSEDNHSSACLKNISLYLV